MCQMSSTGNPHSIKAKPRTEAKFSTEAKIALLKRLLVGSSPKNPTYILGRVVADFYAQTSTELTV